MDYQKVLVEVSEPAESGENQESSTPEERVVDRYKQRSREADNQSIYFGQ